MTDTNMTDTNTIAVKASGGVPQVVEKHMRVLTTRRNDVDRKCGCRGWLCGFVVCCAVSDTTPVVLGVLVVIVAGSRPVVLFEPGC